MKNDDIMGFRTSPEPSRKTLRGNRDNIIIHDQEISDMRASLERLIDQIQNEAKLSGQKDPKAFAELSLAEQLNVEVRTLRKFIDDDSREIHLKSRFYPQSRQSHVDLERGFLDSPKRGGSRRVSDGWPHSTSPPAGQLLTSAPFRTAVSPRPPSPFPRGRFLIPQ